MNTLDVNIDPSSHRTTSFCLHFLSSIPTFRLLTSKYFRITQLKGPFLILCRSNKQGTIASQQLQESTNHTASPPPSPGSRRSAKRDLAPWNDELQREYEEFCTIPIYSKSSAPMPSTSSSYHPSSRHDQKKYFLETVTPPGKFFANDLVSEDALITTNPSDLQSLLEEIAISEYAKEAVFEESAEETSREPQQEGSNRITEHGSGEDNFGDVSMNNESAFGSEPHSSDTGDVEKDEPSVEDSSDSGVWIMGVGDSG
ncbi:uncharacterized protein PAC_17360 [Phialocephala subalpina]|uniref:Uncharacterized protein n=1 Tax=Phialocephala subalpina TaxID=576137 RepID=A0A1L7XQX4_9HELO|nr:uncharacterized protein PAC_17360 [Phialocephala subalpina]